ncbi:arrestin homolog isoform X2 [Procambarus clarkii]|uniref:arrestin homolog isoform X2 n=1 Tax=Procambarus clarkii TaxID=6728 RepID=UPI003744524A
MGLRFCNEACLQAQQLWPVPEDDHHDHMNLTPLQDTLVKRLGAGAVPFTFTVSSLAPPSVTLLPARTYVGAPIGTNYDLRIFVGENPEDKPHKRSSIRMGMKLYQMASGAEVALPYAAASKPLLLADGQVEVEATLDKAVYERDEQVNVNVSVTNHSSRNVRRIKILVVQYVDVAMFSNGKFKNIVATLDTTDGCPITSGATLTRQFELQPARGPIKNWIALEEFYDRESALASSVVRPDAQERNVFAIYVSYYVKVKLFTSAIGGEVSVKVPFKLMRRHTVDDVATNTSPTTESFPETSGEPAMSPEPSGSLQQATPPPLPPPATQQEADVPDKQAALPQEEEEGQQGGRGGAAEGDKVVGGTAGISRCLRLCRLCLGSNRWGADNYLPVHV